MGCDIHCYVEKRTSAGWVQVQIKPDPMDVRSYGIFGFLAGVRNYSDVPPLAAPRGLPADMSFGVRREYEGWRDDAHTPSWLSMEELMAFNYSAQVEDRRCTRRVAGGYMSGAETCAPGEGEQMPWSEFLGDWFMDELKRLKDAGAERLVFWFDN